MKKEKKNPAAAIFAVLLAATATLHAQQNSDTAKKQVELKEITVTATRSEKNIWDEGRSVTVITNEDIKNSGANTVSELLSQQEGIYVVGSSQNPGQLNSLFLRGANSNHTLIIVDGVRISDPSSTDNAVNLSELSLSDIEKIEIVRGSHSTLYGSSAIGGVINIITKKEKPAGCHTDISLMAGMLGEATSVFEENIFLNYSLKSGFFAGVDLYNNNTKGIDATVDTVTNPKDYIHTHREKDDFSKTDITGKLGFKKEKISFFGAYKITNQKTDIDDGAFKDDDNYTYTFKRNLVTYGASWKPAEKFSLAFSGGLTNLVRELTDDSSVVADDGTTDHSWWEGNYKGNAMNNELTAHFKTTGITITAGGGSQNERMTFRTRYYSTSWGIYESKSDLDTLDISANTTNGFIHADLDGSLVNEEWRKFALGLGMRNTTHELAGSRLTYEVNPSVKINETGLLYFSISTGFNAPSLYQLYSPDKDFTSGITRGNKTLKPEHSRSYELGFKQPVNNDIRYGISYFQTTVENSIDYVYLWNKNQEIDSLGFGDYRGDTYLNIGTQTNHGLEFSIQADVSDKVKLSGNVSLVSGKLEYNPSAIDKSHTQGSHVQLFSNGSFLNKSIETVGLVRRPATGNLSITYSPVEKISVGAAVRYVGPRSDIYYNGTSGPFGALSAQAVGDYVLTDLFVSCKPVKGFMAMLRIENVFDVTYYEIYGYATRGRSVYLTLRYSM